MLCALRSNGGRCRVFAGRCRVAAVPFPSNGRLEATRFHRRARLGTSDADCSEGCIQISTGPASPSDEASLSARPSSASRRARFEELARQPDRGLAVHAAAGSADLRQLMVGPAPQRQPRARSLCGALHCEAAVRLAQGRDGRLLEPLVIRQDDAGRALRGRA